METTSPSTPLTSFWTWQIEFWLSLCQNSDTWPRLISHCYCKGSNNNQLSEEWSPDLENKQSHPLVRSCYSAILVTGALVGGVGSGVRGPGTAVSETALLPDSDVPDDPCTSLRRYVWDGDHKGFRSEVWSIVCPVIVSKDQSSRRTKSVQV